MKCHMSIACCLKKAVSNYVKYGGVWDQEGVVLS